MQSAVRELVEPSLEAQEELGNDRDRMTPAKPASGVFRN
jgi:hypothetical protein